MSLESPEAQQQPLLPRMIEDRIMGLTARGAGVALAIVIAAAWISLLTWSAADPSLTHATGGSTRNLLGALGAIVSDLMLQMLGIAAVLLLLAPMLWAAELILKERIKNVRLRGALFPASVLLLAGALSSLPIPQSWPLSHGLGGIVGDMVYGLVGGVLAMVNAERGGLVAGLVLFASGFAATARSLGQELADLSGLMQSGAASGAAARPGVLSRLRERWQAREAPARGHMLEPGFRPAEGAAGEWEPLAPAHAPPTWTAQTAHVGDTALDAGTERAHHAYDGHADLESRAMAERFAPAGGEAHGHHGVSSAPQARKGTGFLSGLSKRRADPVYRRPSLNLLKRAASTKPGPELTQAALRGNARLLEDVLADFGIKGEIKEIKPGPVVTLYELEPARGTKSSRVIGLADDIARSMSAACARVAVVPGRNAIGIELPNFRRDTVYLRDILDAEPFKSPDAVLPLALGRSIAGEPVAADLARMPHLLVAGTTGSGKSVGINAMILSLVFRLAPEDCRLLMIDPKMLELSVYNGIPHLLTPVITDPQKAVCALDWAVAEMEERYKRMSKLGVRNIDVYNNRVGHALKRGEQLVRTVQTGFDAQTGQAVYEKETLGAEPMPYIVVVVDELADLMLSSGKEIEAAVQRLAQMARAAGIHLIMATQRPSVDILTGTIKANFPARISFKVASKIDSRTILNEQGAEQLLGQGDMLYSMGSGQIMRVHGAFVSDEEVEAAATYLRQQGEPRYVEGITEPKVVETVEGAGAAAPEGEALYEKAVAIVLRDRKPSTSYLQRRLGIGYNRAADLMDRMEREGLVGKPSAAGKRDIIAGGGPWEGDAE